MKRGSAQPRHLERNLISVYEGKCSKKGIKGTIKNQKMGGTFISKFHEKLSVWSDFSSFTPHLDVSHFDALLLQ